jgi:hypothetical protein
VDRHVSRFCASLQISVRTVLQFQHVLCLYLPMRQVFVLRSTIKNLQNIGYESQSTSVGWYNCVFTNIQGVHFNVSLSTAVLIAWQACTHRHVPWQHVVATRQSIFRSALCGCYRTKTVVKIGTLTVILTTTALVLYRTLDIWMKLGIMCS